MKRILIICFSVVAAVAIGWGIPAHGNDKSAMLRVLFDEGEEFIQNLAFREDCKLKSFAPLDFLTRMSHRHPELTNNDIRLLGFIRQGIKPSVIASALNITPTSLNSARYRLRKKLQIPNETDLREYLLGI